MHRQPLREPIGAVAPRSRARRWLIDAAVIAAAFFLVHAFMVRGVVRGALPPLSGALVDGTPLTVEQWQREQGGGPFLLYVWARWCPICKAVEPNVDAVAADWPVLSVAMQSGGGAEVGRFMAQRGYRWPTLVDSDARLSRELGVDAVPTLIVVDGGGEVSAVTRGYTSEAGIRLRLWWAQRFE